MFVCEAGEKPEVYPLRYIEDFSPASQADSDGRSDFAAARAFFNTLLSHIINERNLRTQLRIQRLVNRTSKRCSLELLALMDL